MPTVQGATVGRSRVTYGSAWSLNRDLASGSEPVPIHTTMSRPQRWLFAQLVDRLSIRRFNLVVVVCPYRPSSRNAPWCGSAPQVAAPRLLVSSSNLTPHACEGHGNLRALFSNEALILSIFVLPASLGYWDVFTTFPFLL
ncbi:hypothetical protein FA13DRAFT_1708826 [Coprinellus micaceus]|uniref:Uncharacterized protein n=1 Tax=Coprinellus micaceus TaxID=71717 RepID=A0A4Y7TF94_COPMI|nr:hypothetical protein FA13DRAFT_1708826 [Coprinellus micaceus]